MPISQIPAAGDNSSGSLRVVEHHIRKQPTVKSNNARKEGGSPNVQQMSSHQHYLLQQMYSNSQSIHQHSVGTAAASGLQQQHPPKTPNDIYGFAQKAILHSIFDRQISGGAGAIGTLGSHQSSHGGNHSGGSYIKTRHTTPFISNLG